MTPKTAWSLFLLALIFPAQEFWQVWRSDNSEVNWWIALDYPLSIQWYFKDMGNCVSKFLMSLVIFRITYKIQAMRNAAIVVLIYSSIELLFFFICYNRAAYALIYATIGLVSLLVIHWGYFKRWIYTSLSNLFHKHSKV